MKDEENPSMLRISLKDLTGTPRLSSFQIKISDIYWLYTLIKCCGIQTQNAAMIDHDGTITVKKKENLFHDYNALMYFTRLQMQ